MGAGDLPPPLAPPLPKVALLFSLLCSPGETEKELRSERRERAGDRRHPKERETQTGTGEDYHTATALWSTRTFRIDEPHTHRQGYAVVWAGGAGRACLKRWMLVVCALVERGEGGRPLSPLGLSKKKKRGGIDKMGYASPVVQAQNGVLFFFGVGRNA